MSWKNKISGTFGTQDLYFAMHPLEANKALDLLKECYNSNIPLQDVLNEAEQFLKNKNANAQYIQNQLKEISNKFGGWLS